MKRHIQSSAFGFKQPEQSLGFLLWQTTVVWQRLIKKALDEYMITHAQFVLLALLLYCKEIKQQPTQTFLSAMSKLDKMTVSKSLKVLVRMGLVERSEDRRDTRAKIVVLTAEGEALAAILVGVVEKIDEMFFASLSPSEVKIFADFFQKLKI